MGNRMIKAVMTTTLEVITMIGSVREELPTTTVAIPGTTRLTHIHVLTGIIQRITRTRATITAILTQGTTATTGITLRTSGNRGDSWQTVVRQP